MLVRGILGGWTRAHSGLGLGVAWSWSGLGRCDVGLRARRCSKTRSCQHTPCYE